MATVAEQFLSLFFSRHDTFGQETRDGSTTQKTTITAQFIDAHLRGFRRIGAHSTAPNGTCRYGCIDIDHDKPELTPHERNALIALGHTLVEKARELGLPLFLERTKSECWHTWLFADEPVPAATMRLVLRFLLDTCGFLIPPASKAGGPCNAIELFPGQDEIGDGFGNWVYLPYFGNGASSRTVILDPESNGDERCWTPDQFLANVQTAPAALLTELAQIQAGHDRITGTPPPRDTRPSGGDRPGDEYTEHTNWEDILEPHGWVKVRRVGNTHHWRRPGKHYGISATTNHAGSGLLYVFSSSTPFEANRGYGKFSAYTVLNHNGDFAAAARELGERGFGRNSHSNGFASDEEENAYYTKQEREPSGDQFTPIIRCATAVEPEEIDYLWYPYFPLGKIGLLGGDPGMGKTYLVTAVITSLSLGHWPFYLAGKESVRTPSNTLVFSTEDGVEDTLVPRLIGLGADRSFVHFQEGKKDWKGILHRVVLDDEDILIRSIRQVNARLVVFDPFQGFLPPRAKMNDMETVRPVLSALIRAARATKCFILLLGHLSKAKQESIGYKFLGSVDWYAGARSAMLITANPEKPDEERFFYHLKHSFGKKAPGRRFSIAEINDPPFLWGDQTDVTPEDAFDGKRTTAKEDEAKEFLKAELAGGFRQVDALKASAKTLNLAWRTVERAKKKLKIRVHKDGYQGPWVWELPQ